mgnify:CR=1 FL=1
MIFQSIFKNRSKHYRIDITAHWSDQSLVWEAFAINGNPEPCSILRAEKVKTWTRAEQRAFPKTVGKYAHSLVEYCNTIRSAA